MEIGLRKSIQEKVIGFRRRRLDSGEGDWIQEKEIGFKRKTQEKELDRNSILVSDVFEKKRKFSSDRSQQTMDSGKGFLIKKIEFRR